MLAGPGSGLEEERGGRGREREREWGGRARAKTITQGTRYLNSISLTIGGHCESSCDTSR